MDGLNMRKNVLHHTSERLLRHGAVILLAGMVAGCSGDMTRFTDGITTGSTNSQRPIMQAQNQSVQQMNADSYPVMPATQRVVSGNVQRNELPPVGSAAPMGAAQVAQNTTRNVVQNTVNTVHNTGQSLSNQGQQIAAAGSNAGRAVAASANSVMVQPGETLYGVARRLNVSPNDLMAANNITDPNMLRAGQTLTVPGVKAAAGGSVAAAGNSGAQTLGQLKSAGTQAVADAKQTATNKVNTAVANAGSKVAAAAGGYTVQSGDTLHAIAQRSGVSAAAIKQANGMSDGTIRVGQTLIIPAAANAAAVQVAAAAKPAQAAVDTTVKTASTPPAAAKHAPDGSVKPYTPPQTSNKVIENAEKDVAMAPSATGISQMRWPVRGKVLTSFGQRDGGTINDGIDIMVPEGTPVKAAENGVVIYAGDGLKEFGQTVLVRHENGLVTVYGHNSKLNVQRGQKVRRGEEIARSGMSGNAKSPKLHFEVRKNSTPVNPAKYLEG